MTEWIHPYQTGRLDAKNPVGLGAIHAYMSLPTASAIWAGPDDSEFDYGMLGNDRYGNCTFAGFVHMFQAICLLLGIAPTKLTDAAVIKAYLLFTHGQDSGCVEADVLAALRASGILGEQLFDYAPGVKGLAELLSITETFGAAYLGIQVPAPCQTQFTNNEPWDLTGTSADNEIEGGHCVVGVAFDQNADMYEVITWGRRQKVTFRWLDRYLDEQWAVITEQVKAKGILDGSNFAQLTADLDALKGAQRLVAA